MNGAFRQRASVNGAVRDHLSVDHFTALSIAANSCLSSLERAHLLITMGFMLSKTRDWKFGRWNFAEIRGASDAALTGGVGCWGYGLFGDRCRTLGFGCRRHGCGGVVVASGSIDSSQPLAHARGSGRGRAEAVGDAIVGAPAVGEWLLRADQSIRANRLLTRAARGGDGPRLSETRLWEPRLWGSGCCERINRFEPTACSRARLRAWTGRFPTFLRESDMNLPAGGSKRERRFVDERGIFVSKGS